MVTVNTFWADASAKKRDNTAPAAASSMQYQWSLTFRMMGSRNVIIELHNVKHRNWEAELAQGAWLLYVKDTFWIV